MILTADGPVYIQKDDVNLNNPVCRVRNMYYDCGFAEMLLRELLIHRGKLRQTSTRLQCTFLLKGIMMATLMPSHGKTMWGIVEDLMTAPEIRAWRSTLQMHMLAAEEYQVLTLDGTMKICFAFMGQPKHAYTTRSVDSSAWTRDEETHKVLTVRGRTSAVLACVPIRDEASSDIVKALKHGLPDKGLQQVRFCCVDNASEELWRSLRSVMPNLQCICLDTQHLVMKHKSSNGHKQSPGSQILQRNKIHTNARSNKMEVTPVYTGENRELLVGPELVLSLVDV